MSSFMLRITPALVINISKLLSQSPRRFAYFGGVQSAFCRAEYGAIVVPRMSLLSALRLFTFVNGACAGAAIGGPIQDYANCVDRAAADELADRVRSRVRLEEQADRPTRAAAIIREQLAQHPDTTKAEVARLRACLDDNAAVNAAADTTELKAAVQGYYVAASSLLDASADDREVRASADRAFDDAKNKLRAEASTAGKW